MLRYLPKTAIIGFLVTAVVYVSVVSYISYPLTTFLKPLPIVCLIAGVLASHCLRWAKVLLVIALLLSSIGDIVLTLPIHFVIELGIGFFLWAHCCYIALFIKSYKYDISHLVYFLPILILIGVIGSILIPKLGSLLIPSLIYISVLMIMVYNAFQVKEQSFLIGSGAVLFLISDLSLAFNLFKYPELDLRIIIITTYYVAQFLLAWGLINLYANNK